MIISFDFDNTLSTKKMQNIAKMFIKNGHDVYITTRRYRITPFYNNSIVYDTAENVGIPLNKIRFTDGNYKYTFLNEFDIHFDDEVKEIDLINNYTNCVGILV
jgi:hypothetical protein